jgi:ABC-type transporter Mla maintaining outer membrane lipid asymmetry permease subunit MlaE
MIEKLLGSLVMAVLFVFLAVFGSFIGAFLVYFMWNHLAPLYFVGVLPAQFIHVPFLHCWMFLFMFALVFGNKASANTSK